MKTITSRTNPEIKAVAKLHTPKGRKDQRCFIAQGLRTISTIIQSGWKPITLYTTDAQQQQAMKLVPEEAITQVADEVMEKLSTTATPGGLLAVFQIPAPPPLEQLSAGIVLAHIADPGNMGTLIRSCAAFGKRSVVIIEGADPWSPKVVQATAGTIAAVNIFRLSWDRLINNKGTHPLVALMVSDGTAPEQLDLHNALLVVGSEAHGIPTQWIDQCDERMTMPMPGTTESLNAAVAGSIALYLASQSA